MEMRPGIEGQERGKLAIYGNGGAFLGKEGEAILGHTDCAVHPKCQVTSMPRFAVCIVLHEHRPLV